MMAVRMLRTMTWLMSTQRETAKRMMNMMKTMESHIRRKRRRKSLNMMKKHRSWLMVSLGSMYS